MVCLFHKWDGCKCLKCGKRKHNWESGVCVVCGEECKHNWCDWGEELCKCNNCGKIEKHAPSDMVKLGDNWFGYVCNKCGKIL
jgi:hypothetical protein